MPKRLIIHIGLHKTGSTFIQKQLSESQELLAARGISYPSVQPGPAHHRVGLELLPRGSDTNQYVPALIRHIHETDFEYYLISTESLDRCRQHRVGYIADLLENEGIEPTIVYFIRNQVDTFESVLRGTRVYHKFLLDPEQTINHFFKAVRYRFMSFYRWWADRLGESQVRVGIYENQRDLLSGFLELCGLAGFVDGKRLRSRERVNASTDPRFVKFGRLLLQTAGSPNGQIEVIEKILPSMRRAAEQHAERFGSPTDSRLFSDEERARILAEFLPENQAFSKHVMPLPEAYFEASRGQASKGVAQDPDAGYLAAMYLETYRELEKDLTLRQHHKTASRLASVCESLLDDGHPGAAEKVLYVLNDLFPDHPKVRGVNDRVAESTAPRKSA